MVTSGRLPNNGRRGGAPRAMGQTLTVRLALLFFFNKATCVTAARDCTYYIFCTPCLTPRSSTRTSPSELCATHIHPTWPRPQPHFFLSLIPVDPAVPLVLGRSCLGPGSLIARLLFFPHIYPSSLTHLWSSLLQKGFTTVTALAFAC